MRACREAGVGVVAVVSEADTAAMHAELADRVVVLGPPEPGASYLRQDLIIAAARETGADAIHPGYGFLAENAGFARAVTDAGLVFIGPSAEVIESMGEKTAARAVMEQAGVPVVPGALLPVPDAEGSLPATDVQAAAEIVGYPLMVKAAFGGGGKGMRLVEDPAGVQSACEAATREARKAFGDGKVYLEKYLQRPRHVEFQIFGDSHGNYVHLFERECSIQRRHQKIIEESPSPAVDDALRARMGQAAVAAASAVAYEGAGTVEFLLDDTGEFYFLEMNTRLQVEHPVTEWITGQDLVRAQLTVAAGEPLPWTQDELRVTGHSIECRVCAEDPAQDFMPSLGRLLTVREPAGPGVRMDSGVRAGDEISMHYDPLIAKLSVHGADRGAAIDRAMSALRDYAVLGPDTNIEYLLAVLDDQVFRSGDLHTGFLAERLPGWRPDGDLDRDLVLAAAALQEQTRPAAAAGGGVRGDDHGEILDGPWERLGAFRLRGLES
ncbi:MAG: ATP-grasp domain-containing protein [bacterium]|nr:ATP-grasp domain-containing protein [bacterium]